MIVKGRENRDQIEVFSIEEFVPTDHLLRKIDSAVDFSHIYDIVEDLYCADNGRPSIDPVVIFKMVLIQHLYGLPSLRRTVEEIKMNVAYRWFLGYLMNEQIPHFSTVSYNFRHRYTEKTIEEIFYWILSEIERAGYLSPETVFVDGTHIKANANIKKAVKKAVPQAAKRYEEELMAEINEDRETHGKKPFDGPKPPEEKEITASATDPESGMFHKGEHKKCFAYTAQTGCDKNGYVMEVTVNPGMSLFEKAQPIGKRQKIAFKCSACGACCKNVRDSIVLEPLDAFRIIRDRMKNGSKDSADDILWNIADLKELSRGFDVFVLRTVNDSGVCGMLKDNRCTIYSARPRTCRLYPFTADPCPEEHRIKWLLCMEQPHHFGKGTVTAREWQRKNVTSEDEEFLYEECRVLPKLGEILRDVPEDKLQQAEQHVVVYRYLAYDFSQPFLLQYKDNMLFLKSILGRLTV